MKLSERSRRGKMLKIIIFIVISGLFWTSESTAIPNESRVVKVIAAAKQQIGVTLGYDGTYRKLAYPNGDVPKKTGVCTDVIIRALRAVEVDLQVLVHRDMKSDFKAYPKNWGLGKPDPNIDHRRVPNLITFFKRMGKALPITNNGADYHAGDIVTWRLPSGLPHIGLVSDTFSLVDGKRPQVIHNIGQGTQSEDVLFEYSITGHFRYFE